MPKFAIYPSTRGLSSIGKHGFQHVLYGKISKKLTFFFAAILDHFQTEMFKSETTLKIKYGWYVTVSTKQVIEVGKSKKHTFSFKADFVHFLVKR